MNIEVSLQEISRILGDLPAALEQDFLRVGEKLRVIALTTMNVSQKSAELVNLMSDGSIEQFKDELKQLLLSYGGVSGTKLAAGDDIHVPLKEMERLLDNARRRVSDLQRHNGSLRNLALQTRITSQSNVNIGENFATVAENIKNLGLLINEKTAAILTDMNRLCSRVSEASARTMVARSRKQSLVEGVSREIRYSIDKLGKAHEQCGSFSELIAGQSTSMSNNIAGVVSSIQYHDITRQKMEHVRGALGDILTFCRKDAAVLQFAESRNEIINMCELQLAQLHHVQQEIDAAIGTIAASLQTITAASDRIADNAGRLRGAANQIDDSELGSVEHNLALALSYHNEELQAEEELFLLMQSVVETSGGVAHFLDGIDEIGDEIKLIAMNAMVKALQLQQEGTGLNVIAAAIKNESDAICSETADILALFQLTTARADQLKSVIEQIHGVRVEEQDSYRNYLQAKLAEIRQHDLVIKDIIMAVNASTRQLGDMVADALSSVSKPDLKTKLKKKVIPTLEEIVGDLRRNQSLSRGTREGGEMLGKLRSAYTMNFEREVHDRYLAGDSNVRGNVIPFPKMEIKPAQQIFDEENLGLNVELF